MLPCLRTPAQPLHVLVKIPSVVQVVAVLASSGDTKTLSTRHDQV